MSPNDPPLPSADSEAYEHEHVHTVYEQISTHFSSTRHKPWPIVSRFLCTLPAGSIGLDVGCGNGKYLAVNPDVLILASDRSTNLASIAASAVANGNITAGVVVADALMLPHPLAKFDFALSIAVVHHLSTRERRVEAIMSVLEMLRSDGKALFFVWALEQEGSRRGWKEGGEQDVMVPWVMRGEIGKPAKKDGEEGGCGGEERVYQRYYHLYCKGELEDDVRRAGGAVLESGYERDNWWTIATPSLRAKD